MLKDNWMLSYGEVSLAKAAKLRYCVSNNIVFSRDKIDVSVKFLKIIEPANDTIRSGFVWDIMEVANMNTWHLEA